MVGMSTASRPAICLAGVPALWISSLMPSSALTISLLLGGMLVADGEVRPYEVDEFTLQLWHLNEDAPPFKNSVKGGTSLRGIHNGAAAGEQGFPGLGRAVSFNHHKGGTPGLPNLAGGIVTLAPGLASGPQDNAPEGFQFQGRDGAFTCEAMVKFDRLPSEAPSVALAIITMDSEQNDRVFSFRVEREGFLSFSPLPDSGAVGGAIASIPTNGPNAINTKDWFHVAVSYDGRPGVPGALQLYWTRLDSSRNSANRIGVGMLSQDLAPISGDFAVGNEARNHIQGNAEAEPFPGLIDEVRLSSVARHPTDFLFVPPGARASHYPTGSTETGSSKNPFQLRLTGIGVDGEAVAAIPAPGTPLSLKPGLHRLDFDIGAGSNFFERPVQLRCQLAGFDEHWQESVLGMSLTFEFLDPQSKPISQAEFNMTGSSSGWATGLTDSIPTPRREILYAPENAAYLRVTLSSGAPDTSGCMGIDDLNLVLPDKPDIPLWPNGNFEKGSDSLFPMRPPAGWTRGGTEPAFALVSRRDGSAILSLIDGDQSMGGKWTAVQPIDAGKVGGRTLIVTWREAYNVITGNQQRATFLNVPPGDYVFRAIGMTEERHPKAAGLSARVVVRPHLWQRGWFWPAATACIISLIAVAVVRQRNRRNRRRLGEAALQEIALDQYDDEPSAANTARAALSPEPRSTEPTSGYGYEGLSE